MSPLLRLGLILVPAIVLLSSAALLLRSQLSFHTVPPLPCPVEPSSSGQMSEFTVASFNVRYDSSASTLSSLRQLLRGGFTPFKSSTDFDYGYPPEKRYGELHWTKRAYKVVDTAIFHRWDIFSFQEVLPGQLHDLVGLLDANPEGLPPLPRGGNGLEKTNFTSNREYLYDWVGVPRNDGKTQGEAVPVFWRNDKFRRVAASQGGTGRDGVEHFWLSPTPHVPGSVGWDAAHTRMCTHVTLQPVSSEEQLIHVFSTHYDHLGVRARAESSKLILQKAREAVISTRETVGVEPLVLLLGDLNSPRNEDGWRTLVNHHHGVDDGTQEDGFTFFDGLLSVPTRFGVPYWPMSSGRGNIDGQKSRKIDYKSGGLLSEPYGSQATFIGFQKSQRTANEDRIDFIMYGDTPAVKDHLTSSDAGKSWQIVTYGELSSWSEGDAGFQLSDHRPLQATFAWK